MTDLTGALAVAAEFEHSHIHRRQSVEGTHGALLRRRVALSTVGSGSCSIM